MQADVGSVFRGNLMWFDLTVRKYSDLSVHFWFWLSFCSLWKTITKSWSNNLKNLTQNFVAKNMMNKFATFHVDISSHCRLPGKREWTFRNHQFSYPRTPHDTRIRRWFFLLRQCQNTTTVVSYEKHNFCLCHCVQPTKILTFVKTLYKEAIQASKFVDTFDQLIFSLVPLLLTLSIFDQNSTLVHSTTLTPSVVRVIPTLSATTFPTLRNLSLVSAKMAS